MEGANDDNLSSMVLTTDGGILIAGSSASDTSKFKSQNHIGSFDFWISKYKRDEATGVLRKLWDRTVGTTLNDYLNSCVPTRDSGCILAGYKQVYAGGGAILYKLDKKGNIQWSDTTTYSSGSFSIDTTDDKGFIMIQVIDSYNEIVTKLDSSGKQEWRNSISKESYYDIFLSVRQAPDGGYLIGGSYFSLPTFETLPYLIKLDKSGNILWTKKYSSMGVYNNILQAAQGFSGFNNKR